MKKLILQYGVLAGLVVAVMMVVTFSGVIDHGFSEYLGYGTMILAFATIFIAVKLHRDKNLGGTISFIGAFKIGLGITLVASVIYIISWMIISNTIAKDFMLEYYQHSVEQLKSGDLSEAEIKEKLAELEKFRELYKNPVIKIGITFMEIFPVGFVISVVSALILKQNRTSGVGSGLD